MSAHLDGLVQAVIDGANPNPLGGLSTGERCFVALAAERYDLLPTTYGDPVEAWFRLDQDWRLSVCAWRGWPETYAIGG